MFLTFLINVNSACFSSLHCLSVWGDVVVGVSRKVKMKSSYTASDWVNRLKLCNGERERETKKFNILYWIVKFLLL